MFKRITLLICIVALTMLTGCASIEMSSPNSMAGIELSGVDGELDRIAVVTNNGLYILWTFPLGSGDMRWNDKKQTINGKTALFQDYSGLEEAMYALGKVAERENEEASEVIALDNSLVTMELFSYQGAAMGLFGLNSINLSAVLCNKKTSSRTNLDNTIFIQNNGAVK